MKAMNKEEIEKNVMEIVDGHLGIPPFRLNLQTDLRIDLGADELDVKELIITIEEHFSIKIPDRELSHIKKIVDIVNAVSESSEKIKLFPDE